VGSLRRWVRRIERDAREDGIVVELQDGTTRMFPESESLILEFITSSWASGMTEDAGEEYEWNPELKRLNGALDNATEESREAFLSTYTPFPAWEEEVRRRNADAEE
jgi:hypothetical protein